MEKELEKVNCSLKGVASILLMMSEVPSGSMVWSEWALDLLYEELKECINMLETVVGMK